MKLKSNETILKGGWLYDGSSIKSDNITKRIEWLISGELKEIATDETGWNKLYQDLKDNRYWELTYTESEQHGGGAPNLKYLSNHEAKSKYEFN